MASILLVTSTKCNEFYHAFPDKEIESLRELLLKYGYGNGDLTEIKGLEKEIFNTEGFFEHDIKLILDKLDRKKVVYTELKTLPTCWIPWERRTA